MKLLGTKTLLGCMLFIPVLLSTGTGFAQNEFQKVVITVPFAKVYNTLNPDSGFFLAKKNDIYELDHNGKKWYRIWVTPEKIGFIAKQEARIESPSYKPQKLPTFVWVWSLIILILIATGWIILTRKKKQFEKRILELDDSDDSGAGAGLQG